MERASCLHILGLLLLGAVVGAAVTLGICYRKSWLDAYSAVEKCLPAAADFAADLAERQRRDQTVEVRWSDLQALLAEERFAPLRKGGFAPSANAEAMLIFRVNDRYDIHLHYGGGATLSGAAP